MSLRFKIGASQISGIGLFTLQDLVPGELVFDLKAEGQFRNQRDKYTIEVQGEHFMHGRAQFLNHCFNPNLKYDDSGMIYASEHILNGTELTYDYTTSESEFHGDFKPSREMKDGVVLNNVINGRDVE